MIDIYVVRKQVMRRGDYEARRLRGEATTRRGDYETRRLRGDYETRRGEARRREGIVILCIACNITLGKFTHRYTTAHAMTKTRQ